MTVTFHALFMLCLLGTVAFAATAAPRWRWLLAMTAGAITGRVMAGADGQPDAAAVGLFAVAAALLYLFSPRWAWLASVFAGVLAGSLTGLLQVVGAPPVLGVMAVAVLIGITVWLVQSRPLFAPDLLREEALLMVGVLGVLVAVLPGVLDGWQAAANLNVRPEDAARLAMPGWTLSVVVLSSLLGAAHAVWSRR